MQTSSPLLDSDNLKLKTINRTDVVASLALGLLGDNELVSNLENAVQIERRATTIVLHYFAEVELRRIYAKRGYSSLFAMAVEHFKYCAGAAERRISASRLIRQLPEVEQKICDGTLNLTVAAKAHTFFEAERRSNSKTYTREEKREVVALLENKSTREAERELLRISPNQLPRETSRAVSDAHTELRLVLNNDIVSALDRIREENSHANPSMTYGGVIEILVKQHLAKVQARSIKGECNAELLQKKTVSKSVRATETKHKPNAGEFTETKCETASERVQTASVGSARHLPAPVQPESKLKTRTSRARIPVSVRRQVWIRDAGCCTFQDFSSDRRCQSRAFLELDHIRPWSLGGSDSVENLRLVCRAHNQVYAVRSLGSKKMKKFITLS